MAVENNKSINARRKQRNCKCLHNQHGTTQIYQIINNKHKETNPLYYNKLRGFKTPLSSMERSSKQNIKKETMDLNGMPVNRYIQNISS